MGHACFTPANFRKKFLLGRRLLLVPIASVEVSSVSSEPEIGHIHSDGTLDIPFPLRVRDWLIAEGIVTPHHFLPKSGWTTFHVDETNAERALWLLRLSYLRYAVKQATKKGQGRTVTRSALSTNWSRSPAQISSLCLTPLPFPHREPAA